MLIYISHELHYVQNQSVYTGNLQFSEVRNLSEGVQVKIQSGLTA